MFQQENFEVQPKRKLKAGETIQVIWVILVILNSGYLMYYSNCPTYNVFNYFLFFGSLIWLIFLLLTIAIQFKNAGTQKIFNYADWIFILFSLAMFIWANVLYWRGSNACPKSWDWWVFIFIIFGYIAFFAIICVAFMGAIRWWNKKRFLAQHPDGGNVQHHQDYDELKDNKIDYYDY